LRGFAFQQAERSHANEISVSNRWVVSAYLGLIPGYALNCCAVDTKGLALVIPFRQLRPRLAAGLAGCLADRGGQSRTQRAIAGGMLLSGTEHQR
jgi:hypothetical protein